MNLYFQGIEIPNPLPKEEMKGLLKEAKEGNKEAKEKLILHNISLVLYEISKVFYSIDYDKNDLVSTGIIGLIKAIDSFDIERNVEFSTYATSCIDNEILMFFRKIKNYKKEDSLDKVIYSNLRTKDEVKLEDTLSDETDLLEDYIDKDIKQIVGEIVNNLQEPERQIVMMFYGFIDNTRYTQEEIADKLSVTQSSISKKLKKALVMIANQLKEYNIIESNIEIGGKKKQLTKK